MKKNTSFVVRLFCLGCIPLSPIMACGQRQPQPPRALSDFQSWDELDLSARLTQYLDATWVSQGRFSTQYVNPATYLIGLELRFKVGPKFILTPSYYYLGFKSPEGRSGHFDIPLFTATVQKRFERWTFSDRNRLLDAVGIGTHFWIYMNRPRVDYAVGHSNWGSSVFLSDEPFYFWTFHGWTRNRFSLGGRKTFNRCCAVDLYYMRQDDSRLQPKDINLLGLTLEVRVR